MRRILESVGDSFLLECRNGPEPVVSNRVPYEATSPLVGLQPDMQLANAS